MNTIFDTFRASVGLAMALACLAGFVYALFDVPVDPRMFAGFFVTAVIPTFLWLSETR